MLWDTEGVLLMTIWNHARQSHVSRPTVICDCHESHI